MEIWPEGSPMQNGFYLQALEAITALKPTKFVQVKPVTWKNSQFIRRQKKEARAIDIPAKYQEYLRSQHVLDAIWVARWQAHRTQ